MNDIEDKNYYLNTEKYNPELQEVLTTDNSYIANWAREYKDAWHWYKGRVFVSVASYCDSRIYDTLKSIYSEACDETRVFVGLHLQDTQEVYDEVLKLNYPNLRIKFTLKENAKGVVWARNKIREELYQGEEYFLQIDSHSRVKKNWDAILINQYNSIEQPKVVITTYPNHFDMPDPEKKYLNLPYNTPLRIKQFIHPEDPIDNRCRAENLPSLNDYEVKETRWGAAGFFFTQKWWVEEVTMPDEMAFIGEEDHLTFLSYLKGWNLFVPSEATVWHNYEYRLADDEKPYREHNNSYLITDHSVELVNKMLFKSGYERTIEQAEEYFNFKFKRPEKPNIIFVAIAAYLDYEIKYTILDCINKAKHPENLHFSVCLQYDENEGTNESCIDDLIKKYNIKVVKYHHTQSEGGCWARNQAQLAYNDEKYSLQIDSHTRLLQNWDEIAISDYEKLKQNGNKPLLSFLPPSYFRKDELGIDYEFKHIEEPDKIHVPKFESITSEYWPMHNGYSNEIRTNGDNLSAKILYGGFVFGDGNWVKQIIQDPEHYYTGEEFALTIRSFTYGYDIFTPSKILAWHRCHYNPLKKHYTNNSQEIGDAKHRHAMERLRKLIEGEELGIYGLGNYRTVEDYGNFAGIDFKNKVLK
jgi:glycosyltransferase involved in cell wall biosynthesis